MSDKSKNLILNYYKSKLNNKVQENSLFNNIYHKYSNLNYTRRENSNDKNRIISNKTKTTKNSPNYSLVLNSKEFSIEKNKNKYKNDMISNKGVIKDLFIKKINNIDRNDKENISQRQNITKNIFNMYNRIRNESSLISNRLIKNRKTANLISNINLNNFNNSNANSEIFYNKEINNSTNNKSMYNNYKNSMRNNKNANFNNKLYLFNKNLYMPELKKINKEIPKNSTNNSFLKKYIINTNKGKELNSKIENSFNSKIRKVSSIDYLYNNKIKKAEKRSHHINYINENKSDFNISERRIENKFDDIESTNMNLSNRNININKFINKSSCDNLINKKDNTIKAKLNKNNAKISNRSLFDFRFNELANKSSSLISENYLIKSIQYISNNNNCNNINNQNISINININNSNNDSNNKTNYINNIKKEERIIKDDENNNNQNNRSQININRKDEIKTKLMGDIDYINNFIINKNHKEKKNEVNINKEEKSDKIFKGNNSEEKLHINHNKNIEDKSKLKKDEYNMNNINEKRDFSPIYEEELNVKDYINKLNQFNINKNSLSNILLKIKNDNKSNISFNQKVNDNLKDKTKNKLYLEDNQNNSNIHKNQKNLCLSLGKDKKESKLIINEKEKKNNKKEIKNYKFIDLKDFQSSKGIPNEIQVEKKEKIIFNHNKEKEYNNIINKKKIEINKKETKKEKEVKEVKEMLYIPESFKARNKVKTELTISTITKDSSFFKEKLCELSLFIKRYYKDYGKYPNSNIDFYLYGREIGSGAFGKVNIALHIGSGRLVAIKIFAKKNIKSERKIKKIRNEINILSKLRHPFINQILDTFENEQNIFIVMEYICADLLSFIRKREKLSENIAKIIFKQIIEGLKYINKKNIVHRDIKLDNILIDLTNTVKICDFGVSKRITKNEIMIDHCGTPGYIAPEIYKNKGYDGFQCDIWSAGVTLYYMLSGSQPFKAYTFKEMEKKVLKGDYEELKNVSSEANDLIKKMLENDPEKRIKIDDVLNHPWLKNEDVENRKNLKLFTDNEKILLSKYDVNYLSSNKEELIENFTIKNLSEDEDKKLKNKGNTKSVIFSPFNSYVDKSRASIKSIEMEIEEIYKELKVENNICKYAFQAQQENIKYQLSNNNDFDNGIIKTQKEEDMEKHNEEVKKIMDKYKNYNSSKYRSTNNSFEQNETIIELDHKIIKIIEENIGYKEDYLINCIKKNKINYATATYYLLKKDKE